MGNTEILLEKHMHYFNNVRLLRMDPFKGYKVLVSYQKSDIMHKVTLKKKKQKKEYH